jgi:hypothetical protein
MRINYFSKKNIQLSIQAKCTERALISNVACKHYKTKLKETANSAFVFLVIQTWFWKKKAAELIIIPLLQGLNLSQ